MKRFLCIFWVVALLICSLLPGWAFAAQPSGTIVIQADGSSVAEIAESGQIAYFSFTPEYTEVYTFYSDADIYDDTIGYLYDSNMNLLEENDDGGEYDNFALTCELEAGEAYIFGAQYYEDWDTGSFDVYLEAEHEGDGEVIQEPTCTEDGVMTCICDACGTTYTESIPAEHKYADGICTGCGLVWSDSGTCGENVTWHLDHQGLLTISGSGDMQYSYSPSWDDYGDTIRKVVIEEGVTSIGDGAFNYYDNLESVVIPESVTVIGESAFEYCEKLADVTISQNVTTIGENAFKNCDSLTGIWVNENNANYSSDSKGVLFNKEKSILMQAPSTISGDYDIPTTVTAISNYGFNGCGQLTGVTIPNGVTEIGTSDADYDDGVFSYCEKLVSVDLPDQLIRIGKNAFQFCKNLTEIEIPGSVTVIDYSAFDGCSSLPQVTLPEGLTELGSGAFSDCSSLSSVTVPASVTSLGDYVFSDCTNLTSAVIHANVEALEGQMFYDCTSLKSVTLPDSLTTIRYDAFNNCSALEKIDIPSGVTYLDECVFYNCVSLEDLELPEELTYIGDGAFYGCSSLTELKIPEKVSELYDSFSGCTSLTGIWVDKANENYSSDNKGVLFDKSKTTLMRAPCTIEGSYSIPETVTVISWGAFKDCVGLTEIVFADKLTSIGSNAFANCAGLTNLTIPSKVERIGYNTFSNCTGLETVKLPTKLTAIDSGAFYGCVKLTTVEISENVEEIGEGAFAGCTSLDGIWVDEKNENYYSDDKGVLYDIEQVNLLQAPGQLSSSYTIPDGVKSIWPEAFSGCSGLTDIVIPDGVEEIAYEAFSGCSSLTSVVIPDGVTEIAGELFCNCSSLASVVIPNTVEEISGRAFFGCSSLKEINIPASVDYVDEYAFQGCSSLTGFKVADGNEDYFNDDAGALYSRGNEGGVRLLRISNATSGAYTVLNSVTSIAYKAFAGCKDLTSVAMPETLRSISSYAFEDAGVDQVTFTGDAPHIYNDAFLNVTANAFYPAENATWTDDVKQNYGGTITWLTEGEHVRAPADEDAWESDDAQHWHVCTCGEKLDAADHGYTDDTDKSCDVCGYERAIEEAAPLGDVDGSGSLDFFDGMYVLQYYAGLIDDTQIDESIADVDGSGDVNFFDGMYILQYYAGVIDKLPVES